MCNNVLFLLILGPSLLTQLYPPLANGTSGEDAVELLCTAVVADVILASYQFTWMKNDVPVNLSDSRYMVHCTYIYVLI